jgi:hypothetical protein
MKTKSMILVNLLFFSLVSFASSTETFTIQDTNTIEGVFDGHEAYGYNFIIANTDDGSEHTMTFQNIKEELLNQFDLKSETFMGKKFKITYHVKIRKFKDEDGFEDQEEILTITNLEEL